MHEAGILEHVVPNMAHARCLLQFNQYHHYTVDEHTIRTIEAADWIYGVTMEEPGVSTIVGVKLEEALHAAGAA